MGRIHYSRHIARQPAAKNLARVKKEEWSQADIEKLKARLKKQGIKGIPWKQSIDEFHKERRIKRQQRKERGF